MSLELEGGILLALIAGLLVTGAIAGLLAGLLGVGGGIVIVPILIVVADLIGLSSDIAMFCVVGTSLATIIPTSIASARAHRRKGAIDTAILRGWGGAVFAGAALGGAISGWLSARDLMIVFGVAALAVALNLALPKTLVLADGPPSRPSARIATAAPIGFVSALMGIGGGTLAVPVMTMLSVPVHRAVATASVFGLLIAIPAVCGFLWSGWNVDGRPPGSLGYVNLPAAVLLFVFGVFTAPLGAALSHRLAARQLKLAFALFLAISALRMVWRALA